MNKRIIFCACTLMGGLSASHAQSTVAVFGVLDAMAYRKQLAGEAALATVGNGGLSSSHLGVRGAEDLGSGLKANFNLSGFLSMDTGVAGRSPTDSFWSRSAWVGLESPAWGAVRLGRQSAQAFQNLVRYSAFGDSTAFGPSALHNYIPSVAQSMMTGSGAADTGWSNTMSATAPAWGGLVASAMVWMGEATTAGKRSSLSLNYQGTEPWAAGVVVEQIDRMNMNFSKVPANIPMNRSRLINAGASYDFQAAKVYAQIVSTQLDGPAARIVLKTTQLSVAVPVGNAGRLLVAAAQTRKEQTAAAEQRRDTVSVAYDHALSKRSDLYAVVMRDAVSSLSSGTGYAVGMRHRF